MSDIYCFNPTNEMAIANGTTSWQPNQYLTQFEKDLSLITAFLALPTDVALVHQLPTNEHIRLLAEKGIFLPTLLPFNIQACVEHYDLQNIGWLKPWGWSPLMISKLKPLFLQCSEEFQNSPALKWDHQKRNLYSRITSRQVLESLLMTHNLHQAISSDILPQKCENADEIVFWHSIFKKSVLKAPWSSSGRGIQPVNTGDIHVSILNWSRGIIKDQGYLMIEPWYHKLIDFSFQFDFKNDEPEFKGISFFQTDEQGRYLGNLLHPNFNVISEKEVVFVQSNVDQYVSALKYQLKRVFSGNYVGHLGVDAMVVLENNEIKIHPCVEINLRFNMGIVAIKLAEMVGNQFNIFQIVSIKQLSLLSPLTYLPLTEILPETQVCAILSK